MSVPAMIGHNGPPDPIDDALAPWGDAIAEASMWLDGQAVGTEAQMRDVDRLAAQVRDARRAVDRARDDDVSPLHEAWKVRVAAWKPTVDDLDRIQKGLAAVVGDFKKRLAAEKDAALQAAYLDAERARLAAEQAARSAAPGDLDAQRAAAAATFKVRDAEAAVSAAAADTVKGLRAVTRWAVTDLSALLRWINAHDREALARFADDYARRVHRDGVDRPGLRVWRDREAF